MNLFKYVFLILFILLTTRIFNAQKMNFHIGLDLNASSRTLDFSPFGIKFYSNYLYQYNFNLRTNLALNYHKVKNVPETPTLEDCFYTQIEESAIYQFNKNLFNIFSGIGIGYYSINNNGQSDHLHQIDPFNYNERVGHEEFDSNFGIHFLFGKDIGPMILEIKYSYTNFPYHIKYQGTIDNVYIVKTITRKYKFHFFEFSICF